MFFLRVKMKYIFFIRFLVAKVFLLISINAFSQQYYFKKISVEDGLVQSQVVSLCQDHSGYMWIGTYGGISRYDGKKFVNYSIQDGLKDNIIRVIYEDSKYNLWVGTNSGLHKYKYGRFDNIDDFNGKEIKAIRELPTGDLIFATNQGIAFYSDEQFIFDSSTFVKNATSVEVNEDGNLWIGTKSNGVILYSEEGTILKKLNVKTGLSSNVVHSLKIDRNNNVLWIGTENSLEAYYLNKNVFKDKFIVNSLVLDIIQDSKGAVLFATDGNGIYEYDPNRKKQQLLNISTKNGLSSNQIFTLLEGKEGNIWIGTYSSGINIYQGMRFVGMNKKDGLPGDVVTTICEAFDSRWIGTIDAGISRLYNSNNIVYNKENNTLPSNKVWSSFKDSKGNLWIGTVEGIVKYDGNKFIRYSSKKYDLPSNIIYSITEDKKGNIWFATQAGVSRYNGNKFISYNSQNSGLANSWVWKVFCTKQGDIWATTGKGVSKFNGNTFDAIEGNIPKEMDIDVITMTEDHKNNLWFGTYGAGLVFYDASLHTFKVFSSNSGLMDVNIVSLITDNHNNIWIGHGKGVDKIDLQQFYTEGKITLRNYGINEGFIGIENIQNAVYKDTKGNLFFGTIHGVVQYNINEDKLNFAEPQIIIEKIENNKKVINESNANIFDYDQNRFSFEWVGISFTDPTKVRYQFMLEGLDDEWSDITDKTDFTYPYLAYGNYTFKVKACNNDGVWNKNPAFYKFTIEPPFYLTIWFWSISILLLGFSVYSYIRYRTFQIQKEKKILEQKVTERTKELVKEKEKVEQFNKEVINQKAIIEEKNKDITDSINYAKHIQESILPLKDKIYQAFPDSFILYMPKDIVSGDFYWFSEVEGKSLIAAVDCTGHGVPGAFMSVIGHTLLSQIVNVKKITDPALVLNQLHIEIRRALKQENLDSSARDGMDVALCCYDKETNILSYAGAFRPLYHVRGEILEEIKGDRFPIGGIQMEEKREFTSKTVSLEKGDSIFMFTDGYIDQFGGEQGKKFLARRFKDIIFSVSMKKMKEQAEIFEKKFINWRSNLEQIDDVLVIGIRF